MKQDALNDTNSETEKLNDVHFGGFSDLASEQIYSQSLNLNVDQKQQVWVTYNLNCIVHKD
jgi:hypothetical protein